MKTELDTIAPADLRFDPKNPRIPSDVDASDDREVFGWMLRQAGLVELMGSIAAKGFFPAEPLLVTLADDGDGYWVLEGNRRLAAVKLLRAPEMAPRRRDAVAEMARDITNPESLEQLPCVVFDKRSEVMDYLGYRHITGIKQWEPAAKARYLRSLYDQHCKEYGSEVYRYIARLIGSKQDYVKRLLGALRLHDQVSISGTLDELESDPAFSLLTLALNYNNIVTFLGLHSLEQVHFENVDQRKLQDLASWIYRPDPSTGTTQLGESRNMRLLADAVSKPEGLEALRRGETAEDAARATLDPDEMFLRTIRLAQLRLESAQGLLPLVQKVDVAIQAVKQVAELATGIEMLMRRQGSDRAASV